MIGDNNWEQEALYWIDQRKQKALKRIEALEYEAKKDIQIMRIMRSNNLNERRNSDQT